MKNEKRRNRELFIVEAVIGVTSTIMLLIAVAIAAVLAGAQPVIAGWLIAVSVVSFVIVCFALTKMEQIVGYYVCKKCHHKHVPGYNAVLWSPHIGRTRYMVCPKCHKKTWQKKVL